MDVTDVLGVAREAMWVTLKVSGPMMLAGLVIGLAISLVQALTQIQEMTLAFVPKIVVIFGVFLIALPFMTATLISFMHELAGRIVGVG